MINIASDIGYIGDIIGSDFHLAVVWSLVYLGEVFGLSKPFKKIIDLRQHILVIDSHHI